MHNRMPNMLEHSSQLGIKVGKFHLKHEVKWCENCQRETTHTGGRCRVCNGWNKLGESPQKILLRRQKREKERSEFVNGYREILERYGFDQNYSINAACINAANAGFGHDLEGLEAFFRKLRHKIDKNKERVLQMKMLKEEKIRKREEAERIKEENRRKLAQKARELLANFSMENTMVTMEYDGRICFDPKFDDLPGVLFLWGKDYSDSLVCLTGGETKNLLEHLKKFFRLCDKEKVKPYPRDNRWWEVANYYHGFEFVIMAEGVESKHERRMIEAAYAMKNHAIYWRPLGMEVSIVRKLQEPQDHTQDQHFEEV